MEIQYFGSINAVNGGETEDFDGDGSSNYDEWLAGTDPSDATDLLELRPVVGVAWTSVRDRSYEIDYSDNNWKTFIILNGGTTNHKTSLEDGLPFGSLNNHLLTLIDNDIDFAQFNEPDLGDQLTAVVFLVDERVYDKVTYPDFMGTPFPWPSHKKPSDAEYRKWEAGNNKNYDLWVERIGGDINVFLREFLRPLRLA